MQRIVVIGPPGAGKSTFAERLGMLLQIEVFHLDELFWQRSVPPDPEEWAALERGLTAREQWIIDGNYSATLRARLACADTVVYLDLPTAVCLARFVRRRLVHLGRRAARMPYERRLYVTWTALRGIATFRIDHRPGFLEALEQAADELQVAILRSRGDVRRFLAEARDQRATL